MMGKSLKDYPLYTRASAFRTAKRAATTEPAVHDPPVLVVQKTSPIKIERATTRPVSPPRDRPPPPVSQEIKPVSFYAKHFDADQHEGRRIIVCRENVYLAQGNPASELFLEIRAQSCGRRKPPR